MAKFTISGYKMKTEYPFTNVKNRRKPRKTHKKFLKNSEIAEGKIYYIRLNY